MITKKYEGERLLEIDNAHTTHCGSPPSIDVGDKYVGYFENSFGEQWVFIGDPSTGKAVIRGGDCGWDSEYKISLKSPCPSAIVNESEKLWIIACFMAMSNSSFDAVATSYNKAAKRLAEAIKKKLK